MSFLQAIFGAQPASTAPVPAQPVNQNPGAGQPGNIPPTAEQNAAAKVDQSTAPNGTVPAGGAPESPLAAFADLWKIDPTKDGAPAGDFSLNVDPKKLFEAAGKTDFSRALNEEMISKIAAGGEGAVKATVAAMNAMAQATYGQSTLATTKIVEQALAAQAEQFKTMLPNMIKQHQVSDNLANENPVFNNPAVQPIMDALKAQLAVKNPTATASELTAQAKQYIEALGSSFAPKPASADNPKNPREQDWSTFIN